MNTVTPFAATCSLLNEAWNDWVAADREQGLEQKNGSFYHYANTTSVEKLMYNTPLFQRRC